jgi:hypothetical protein
VLKGSILTVDLALPESQLNVLEASDELSEIAMKDRL